MDCLLFLTFSLLYTVVTSAFTPGSRNVVASALVGSKIYYYGDQQFFYLDVSVPWVTSGPPFMDLSSPSTTVNGTKDNGAMPCSATREDSMIVAGGLTISDTVPLVRVFNTSSGTWKASDFTYKNDLWSPACAIDAVNGKFYMFGGSLGVPMVSPSTSNLYTFDAISSTMTSVSNLTASLARNSHTATFLPDGRIIFIGGETLVGNIRTNIPMNRIDIYDTKAATWTTLSTSGPTPSNRKGHSAVLTKENLLIIYGGVDSGDTLAKPHIVVLNATNFTWVTPLNLPPDDSIPGRYYHSAILVGKYMIIAFGHTNSDILHVMDVKSYKWAERFDPADAFELPSMNTSTTNSTNTNVSQAENSGSTAGLIGALVGVSVAFVCLFIFVFLRYWKKSNTESIKDHGMENNVV